MKGVVKVGILPTKGYVFIITYGRSGSTLLQRALMTIDGALIRGENLNSLFALYRSSALVDEVARDFGSHKRSQKDPFFGADEVRPGEYRRALVDAFSNYILTPEKVPTWLGFKEIRSYETINHFDGYMDFLINAFPGGRVIFNIRDVDEVRRSGWWATMDPDDVRMRLLALREKFAAYTARRPERALLMDYDQFKDDPSAFKPLFEFLGEPFREQAIATILRERLDHKQYR